MPLEPQRLSKQTSPPTCTLGLFQLTFLCSTPNDSHIKYIFEYYIKLALRNTKKFVGTKAQARPSRLGMIGNFFHLLHLAEVERANDSDDV